jgi:hypothetical protein
MCPVRRDWLRVYVLLDAGNSLVKIGCSMAPEFRVRDVENQLKRRLVLVASMKGDFTKERALHVKLAAHRVFGEWFHIAPEVLDVVETIKKREGKKAKEDRLYWTRRYETARQARLARDAA